MQRFFPRLLLAIVMVMVAFYALVRGLEAGGRMSIGYEVGDSASYPWATWAQSNLSLLLGVGGIGALIAVGLLLFWLISGNPGWMGLVAGAVVVAAAGALGWGLGQSASGTVHLDSEQYQAQAYQLSVWRGGAPGGWQVWRCVDGGGECTVIQTIDSRTDVEGLSRQASTYVARLEVENDALMVVIETDAGATRIPVTP